MGRKGGVPKPCRLKEEKMVCIEPNNIYSYSVKNIKLIISIKQTQETVNTVPHPKFFLKKQSAQSLKKNIPWTKKKNIIPQTLKKPHLLKKNPSPKNAQWNPNHKKTNNKPL